MGARTRRSGMVAGKEAGLHLPDPIPALGQRQVRGACQMVLEAAFIELAVIEGSESRCQAAKRPDKCKLGGDHVDDETEPGLLRECETSFGLALDLFQFLARGQKLRVERVAAIRCVSQLATAVRGDERTAHHFAARAKVLGPWHDAVAEAH